MSLIKRIILFVSVSAFVVGTASATNWGLQFNGTTDYVQCTTGTAQDLTAGFTVEAWALPTTSTGARRILSNWQNTPSRGWGLGIRDNKWRFTTFGVKDYDTTAASVALGKWTHIAVTLDSSTSAVATFYVNGDYAMEIVGPAACKQSTAALCIGVNAALTEYWQGGLDEVRVWNYVRSAAQIRADMSHALVGNEAGLVLYYPFSEGTGSTTVDGKDGSTGTIHGAVWRAGTPYDPNTAAKDWSLFR